MNDSVKNRIIALTDELNRHNYNYYVLDNPEIEDYEYDMKMQELKKLEEDYPELALDNSPTKRVGGEALNKFEKVSHSVAWAVYRTFFRLNRLRNFLNGVLILLKILCLSLNQK